MIYDSVLWKKELKNQVRSFDLFLKKDKDIWSNPYFDLKLEKFIFTTAYIIRKLLEAYKLSDESRTKQYKIIRYCKLPTNDPLDFWTIRKLRRFYDFTMKDKVEVDLRFICNLFIHSFALQSHGNLRFPVKGFFINSSKTRDQLYYISYKKYKSLVIDISNDEVVSMRMQRNTQTGKIENLVLLKKRIRL